MPEPVVLCRVGDALAGHVVQLLADANVPAQLMPIAEPRDLAGDTATRPAEIDSAPSRPLAVIIDAQDQDRASAVIGLVLPQLLDSEPPSSLSTRLVRADDQEEPPLPVWRGPAGSLLDEPQGAGDDEDDYLPPEPPPLPRPRDRFAMAAWVAAVGSPILLVVSFVLGWGGLIPSACLLSFFAGFGTLIWRSGDHPPREGWDDGAVV